MPAANQTRRIRDRLREWSANIVKLHGNPHYVALGLAIGVFVAMTPTIPFHTLIAVSLCFPLRASKAAAAIGVWFSNPLTIPVFYLASFKTGAALMGKAGLPAASVSASMAELLRLGSDVALAALAGGIVLGIFPAAAAYVITRTAIKKYQAHRRAQEFG